MTKPDEGLEPVAHPTSSDFGSQLYSFTRLALHCSQWAVAYGNPCDGNPKMAGACYDCVWRGLGRPLRTGRRGPASRVPVPRRAAPGARARSARAEQILKFSCIIVSSDFDEFDP